ncbi:hypothetical protein EDB89DRAFT_1817517, partial [Lactarius sanguifluus]
NQLRETLRRWQSAPDPSTNHNFACDRQHEGTAEWFIKDDKFGELEGNWFLAVDPWETSAIINDIITLCEDASASMAYFYFDFRDINKQARHNLLSSLITQLSNRSDHFCDILYRLYKAHDHGARQPSDSALLRCLKEMLTLPDQGPVYLIMDALDECPDTSDVPSPREQVLDFIKDLVDLRIPGLHICVTSRPEVDITDVLESITSQTVFLQDESGQKKDIADYVRSVVYSGSGKFMRRWREEDKEHVIETLSERADGMFRWVFCQLEMLRNCLPQNVRSVLTELPKSLDETYERMLKEIGKVNPHQAHRLLQCLTVASRPLRVEELAEVLALDFDGAKDGIPALNKDWRWDDERQGVLSTCSSLIVIVDGVDEDSWYRRHRVVQFAHFSVKEFLTSDRLANLEADISHFHIRLEPAHTVIAQACLAILLQSEYGDRVESSSPLLEYAARHWVGHSRFESVSLRVEDGIRRLFDPCKPHFEAWLRSHIIDKQWMSFVQDKVTGYENRTPLHAASKDGLVDVALWLLDHGADANPKENDHSTPLHLAAASGHLELVRTLLGHGADVNAVTKDGRTPLHVASERGHADIVRLLIQHGADA